MAEYDSESSSSLDFEDPWVRLEWGLDQPAAAAEQRAARPAAQPEAQPAALPAALPTAQPAPAALPAALVVYQQHNAGHYPQNNVDAREVPPPPPSQQRPGVQIRVPPPPPTYPPPQVPAEGWTLYNFMYAVTLVPGRIEQHAQIYLATGPEFPYGGPTGTSLVRFWWPTSVPGSWHGRWRLDVPGSLFIRFNGRQQDEPARPLHGAHFLGDGIRFHGHDYMARRVVLTLNGVYTVMRNGGLHRAEFLRLG